MHSNKFISFPFYQEHGVTMTHSTQILQTFHIVASILSYLQQKSTKLIFPFFIKYVLQLD